MSNRSQRRRRKRKEELYDPFALSNERRGRKAARRELLTDELVASLTAESREYAVHDTDQLGLYVRVRPRGSISFYYRPHGRSNQNPKSLGSFVKLNVADARLKARQFESRLQRGGNLADMSSSALAGTVKRAFEAYFPRSNSSEEWKKRIEREFRTSVLPALGGIRLSDLTHQQVETLISERSTYYGRRNLRAILSSFLSWCVSTGRVETNVLKGGRTIPRPEARRPMRLDGPELRIVWDACEQLPLPWRNAFRLLIASGYPMREILQFPSNVGDSWSIEDDYFLGPLALEILAEIKRPTGTYLFAAPGKATPMAFQQGMLNRLREAAFVGPFTTGDLHRSSIALAPIRQGIGFRWNDFSPAQGSDTDSDDGIVL